MSRDPRKRQKQLAKRAAKRKSKQQLGQIALGRQLPNGSMDFAIFLMDRHCLGVKNAMAGITSRFDYDSRIVQGMQRQFSSRPISPSAARNLVERAVAYAQNLGLAPHSDYHSAKLLLGNIDREDSSEALEFGKDGKPAKELENKAEITSRYEVKLVPPGAKLTTGAVVPEYDK